MNIKVAAFTESEKSINTSVSNFHQYALALYNGKSLPTVVNRNFKANGVSRILI